MAEFDIWLMLSRSTLIIRIDLAILLAMSLISWAIILMKYIQFHRADRAAAADLRWPGDIQDVHGHVRKPGRHKDSPSTLLALEVFSEFKRLSAMQNHSVDNAPLIMESIRQTTRDEIAAQTDRLFSALPFLATCANAAPLLGLFGTVWGIMHSFQSFEGLTQRSLAAVAPGMAEALVTTALGLIVAIPATLAHNVLLGRLSGIENKLNRLGARFVRQIEAKVMKERPHADGVATDVRT